MYKTELYSEPCGCSSVRLDTSIFNQHNVYSICVWVTLGSLKGDNAGPFTFTTCVCYKL